MELFNKIIKNFFFKYNAFVSIGILFVIYLLISQLVGIHKLYRTNMIMLGSDEVIQEYAKYNPYYTLFDKNKCNIEGGIGLFKKPTYWGGN